METRDKSKGYIDLGQVRITDDVIKNLNYLQTGSYLKDKALSDEDFTNDGCKSYCAELDGLIQFMLELYVKDNLKDSKILMDNMEKLHYIKAFFEDFKAPESNIQNNLP